MALGLVGAALQLFEALELWDNLIVCYQLLDKRVQVGWGWAGGQSEAGRVVGGGAFGERGG